MATTTNYGWTTPDDTALVKDGAAAIRTLGTSVDTTTKNLNPSTTLGDIEYRSSTANTNTRLGIGSTGNVLTVAGGVPTWAAPAGGSPFVGVSVWHDANQTVSNNTDFTLAMNQETFDSNGFHSTVTNNSRLTIPVGKAGKYFVRGLIAYVSSANGYRDVRFKLNGNLVSLTRMQPPTAATVGAIQEASFILDLAEGDYIELVARQTSGGNLDDETAGSQLYPQLQMFLIGA